MLALGMITRITIGERQGLLRLGDIGHGRLGEEAAAFELQYPPPLPGNEPDQLCTPSRPKHTAKLRFL